jgi:hypothetical protein
MVATQDPIKGLINILKLTKREIDGLQSDSSKHGTIYWDSELKGVTLSQICWHKIFRRPDLRRCRTSWRWREWPRVAHIDGRSVDLDAPRTTSSL